METTNNKEGTFFSLYPENLLGLGLNSADYDVLLFLGTNVEFNTMRVAIRPVDREAFVSKLGITDQTFTNAIRRLKELGVICGTRGYYEINPAFIWKGDSLTRKRLLNKECFRSGKEIL